MEDRELFRDVFGAPHLSSEELESVASGTASAATRKHFEECGSCSTDLFLLQEFQAAPRPEEAEAVDWITATLKGDLPRQAQSVVTLRNRPRRPAWRWVAVPVGMAAAIALVVVGTHRAPPPLPPPSEVEVMRSASLAAVAPVGDVVSAPQELRWRAFAEISEYRVKIMLVDRTVIWSGTSRMPVISIPASVRAKMLPYRTLLWEVEGAPKSSRAIIRSSTQRFRVAPVSSDISR